MTEKSQQHHIEIIERFSPFDSIEPALLARLAKDIAIHQAKQGAQLFKIGDFDPDELYLLSGSIKLLAKDGREKIVEAGQANARYPIARLRPRMYTGIANTDIHYFIVSASVLDEIQRSLRLPSHNAVMVQEMQKKAGENGHSLIHEFEQELHNGRFVLPSLPEVAFRIRDMIDQPDCSMADIAKLVNTDPAIAVKLIKTANSVMYRGVSNCTDTANAISRLGLITTKQLVTSFAILALFKTQSHMFKHHMQELWQQSIDVAAYSYALARNLPRFNEEEALLAGLIHGIGEMVVLTYAERFYDLATDEAHLDEAIASLRGILGERVLREWDFAEELVTVARDAGNWMRESDEDSFDYCDLVQVAMLYALQGDAGNPHLPEMSSVPAFRKLKKRHISADETSEIIREAQLQIAELRQIFSH